ncbi:MAG: site-2 protease family protein [Candidatus Nitronauta litoralis]|uniref:Site-2 protease family protein n=1 Tax=Candidatus Nitronauta litoralis TaxID=2705533 RepID=A0A7T0G190_9BACT|nr:MAG: site-2 protease family protein [Candidatus Nitronauta litoralis]
MDSKKEEHEDQETPVASESFSSEPGIPAVQPVSSRFELTPKTWGLFSILFFATVWTTWAQGGPWFSFCLLLILTAHEFGHYFACVKNNVDASLPNFIPAPSIFLAGTFGAFINIKEPIPNRKALMEIGASGPLAGFVVALPVLLIGVALSEVRPAVGIGSDQSFGHSILSMGVTQLLVGSPSREGMMLWIHPAAFAGWFGLFFTAMNLLPLGQLDGGHVIYSMYKRQKHLLVARLSFGALIALGFIWAGWWILAAMVLLMGLQHPPITYDDDLLEPVHKWMGYCCMGIFLLTFIPVPLSLIK